MYETVLAAPVNEHRIGWPAYDPNRPCYTCGAPPVAVVGGQPTYPASCLHPPIVADPATLDLSGYIAPKSKKPRRET